MPAYRTGKRAVIETPDIKLGFGGEAEVYAVRGNPDLVAKIYTKNGPCGPTQTEQWKWKEQKLTAMIKNAPSTTDSDGKVALAWPVDILKYYGGSHDGLMAGFTMPRIDMGQYKDIVNYYNPSLRTKLNKNLARQGLRVPTNGDDLEDLLNVIIRNTLTILGNIHRLGYVIGDVNESNILVNYEGRVAFVDSDSFQVRDKGNGTVHRSPVGKEDFLSPRIIGLTGETCHLDQCPSGKAKGQHNKEFLCFDREAEDDGFAIAVILFKLLMNGAHPMDSTGGSQTYKERIVNREFPFNHHTLRPPNRSENRWKALAPNWKNYFGHTFVTDRRYSANEVLILGHHLASKAGNNLGQQATVGYNTSIAPNGNTASSTPAEPKLQNRTAAASRQPQTYTPAGPRSLQPQTPAQGSPTRGSSASPASNAPRLSPSPSPAKTINCPQCGMDNHISEIYCQKPGCQATLSKGTRRCAVCAGDIPDKARFCTICGEPQP